MSNTAIILSRNQDAITFLSTLLSYEGIEYRLLSEASNVLSLVTKIRPSMIFADMPRLEEGEADKGLGVAEGINAVDILKQCEKTQPQLSVFALAEHFNSEDALTLLRKGLRDCFALPLDTQKQEIQRAIHRARVKGLAISNFMQQHDQLEDRHRHVSRDLSHLKEDQEAGRYVQLKLFPPSPQQHNALCFSHAIHPSLYLSGDFIEYFVVDEQTSLFYLADVSGHGASSAFITILLKQLGRNMKEKVQQEGLSFSPKALLERANEELIKTALGKHLSMFCGVIDHRQMNLTYSTAAFYPPVMIQSETGVELIEDKALPVGVFEGAEFQEKSLCLPQNFNLCLFSDGIMDLLPGADLDSKEKELVELVEKSAGDIALMAKALQLDSLNDLPDDVALLQIKH